MRYLAFILIALTFACKHKPVEPIVLDPGEITLVYTPGSVEILLGNTVVSGTPVVTGEQPISFLLSITPAVSPSQITIDASGVITGDSTLPADTFWITVTAGNLDGSFTFKNVFSIRVIDTSSATAPSNLIYPSDTLFVDETIGGSSGPPLVSGGLPMTFSLSTSPNEPGISINTGNGDISVSTGVTQGNYLCTVTVSNTEGSPVFMNVLTVVVNSPPVLVSFATDINPIITANCTGPACHVGGIQADYDVYSIAVGNIGTTSTPNTILERINRTQGSVGFMPKNGTKLSPAELALIQQWLDGGLQP